MARKLPPATGYVILVVDDEEEAQQSTAALFKRLGHEVLVASSGAECLELVRARDVHLVITDYHMPGMNGAALLRELRRIRPRQHVVIQTGCLVGKAQDALELEELGCDALHEKAAGPEPLLQVLAACLSSHAGTVAISSREAEKEGLAA